MSLIGRALVTAVLALPTLASAQNRPTKDEATGLAVVPPPGYAAHPLPPTRDQAARFELKTPADRDTGCQVAYAPAAQNNRSSQAELDAAMRGREWQEKARTTLGALYDIREATILEGKPRLAFVMVGDLQNRPGLPPRSQEVRTLLVIQETPRGRTSTVCVGERSDFEARRAEFTAIATGATTP